VSIDVCFFVTISNSEMKKGGIARCPINVKQMEKKEIYLCEQKKPKLQKGKRK
jgi:hypothetical protein